MKSSLKNQLIEFIKENGKVRPKDLTKAFNISSVAIHKHLRNLLGNKEIVRSGRPPLVFYSLPPERPFLSTAAIPFS